jgi:hypothetical protein
MPKKTKKPDPFTCGRWNPEMRTLVQLNISTADAARISETDGAVLEAYAKAQATANRVLVRLLVARGVAI